MTARGLHVALAALLVYVIVAPSTILGGDNAEFSTLLATGGAAHPSGYPLYVLYLRVFAWLPVPPAHAAALATALLGAGQLYLLHAACRAWGARPASASLAVAIYGGGPLVLLLHTQAEVFALNGAIVAAILLLSGDAAPRRGLARVATLGLLAGLGMSNHLSCVLIAPIGVIGAVRGARESGRIGAAIALGAGGLALGLTPYLYLLVADGGWGDLHSVGAVLDHALRREYGTFSLGAGAAPVSRGDQLAALASSLGRGWWYAPLAAAAWGFGVAIARPRDGATRGPWIGLALALVLAGPVFAVISNVPVTGLGRGIVERFHLLPLMLLVVPVARGLDEVTLPRRLPVAALAVVVLLANVALSWPHVRAHEGPQVERYLRNTLRILPEDAVVLGTGDHELFGFAYLQRARGVRTDVVYVDLSLLVHPWYRARIDARLGFDAIPPGAGAASGRLVATLLGHGRPVFVDGAGTPGSIQARIVTSAPSYPWGTVIRLVARAAEVPSLDDLEAENARLLDVMSPRGPRPAAGDGWAAISYATYAAPWQALARAFAAAHRADDAARCAAIAEQLTPEN